MPKLVNMRVVLRRGDAYALYYTATLNKNDLHMAAHARFPFPGFNDTNTLLRSTYHASGQTHAKVRTRRVTPPQQAVPLSTFTGRDLIGGISGMVEFLEWNYRPKQDSATRRTLVLDLDAFGNVPWSVEHWAIEHGRPDLVEQTLREEAVKGVIVNQLLVDHTNPQFLFVARRMFDEAWAALRQLMH